MKFNTIISVAFSSWWQNVEEHCDFLLISVKYHLILLKCVYLC
jgi:hypothetical protein